MILANTATQVMAMQIAHLFIGNAVIGVIEAVFLWRAFKARLWWALPLMIAANYASMWFGAMLLTDIGGVLLHVRVVAGPTIENYRLWLAMLIVACFVVTVLIEAPLVWLSLRPGERTWRRWLKANLITQLLTYSICIVPAYGLYGRVRVGSTASVEPVASFVAKGQPYWVYYIDFKTGDIYRIRPDGSRCEHVVAAGLTSTRAFLFCFAEDKARPRRDLWSFTDDRDERYRVLMTDFAAPRSEFLSPDGEPFHNPPWHLGLFHAAELRPPSERAWTVRDSDNSGIIAAHENEKVQRLTFSTGFGTWPGRNPTVLPGDIAIFALGDQICAWDLNQRKLGLIARGRGPVVVPDEDLVALPEHPANPIQDP